MSKPKGNGLPDPIDAAVRAAEAPAPQPVEQLNITISSTGRPFIAGFPPDMTEAELFEVVGFLSTALRQELIKRAATRGKPRIEIARSLPGVN